MSENFRRGFKTWCEDVSLRLRSEINLRSEEPLNPYILAGHLGIKIWQVNEVPGLSKRCLKVLLEDDPDSWSAMTLCIGSQRLIILNSKHNPGRQSNTIAHEISHIILDHQPARIDVSPQGLLLNNYDKNQELEAAWLGETLLLPRAALLFIKKRYTNLKLASEAYGVSNKLLQSRLDKTGVNNQYKRSQARKKL